MKHRRSFAELRGIIPVILLLAVAAAVAGLAHVAGWPLDQVLMTGILAGTVLLWITEALPLFAAAFIAITLELLLLGNPGGWPWLGPRGDAAELHTLLAAAADPVLLLFFSGLVLSRAARNTGVDRHLAALVLRPLAATPERLLLGVMLVTSCFSLWMSNTATTALVLALLVPILGQVPAGHRFRKALIVSVPVAANIAGVSTPISSPPNALAISYLSRAGIDVTFLQWMAVAVPLAVVLIAATWWWLLRRYSPAGLDWRLDLPDAPLSGRGAWVIVVAVTTFAAWVSEPWHGLPAPVAAVVPVTLLFATHIITREDVNSLDWDVLILIAGGLALGFGLQVTALDQRLAALVPAEASDAARLAVLGGGTLALGTFFSNTAIASMLMPIAVIAAGIAPEGIGLTSYAMTVALVASMSMALPVSTPPNALAHATGELTARDFVGTGGLIGLAGTALIVVAALLTAA